MSALYISYIRNAPHTLRCLLEKRSEVAAAAASQHTVASPVPPWLCPLTGYGCAGIWSALHDPAICTIVLHPPLKLYNT